MFYCKDFGIAVFQGGGTHGVGHIFNMGRDFRMTGKIHSPESNTRVRFSRQHGKRYRYSGVKPIPTIGNGFFYSML